MTRTDFSALDGIRVRIRQWAAFFGVPTDMLLDVLLERACHLPHLVGEGEEGLSGRLSRVVAEINLWDFPSEWVEAAMDRQGSLAELIRIGELQDEGYGCPNPWR